MKPSFIIDTSIVVKWFSSEKELFVQEADELSRLLQYDKITLFAPSFLFIELTNILLRKKHFPQDTVQQIVAHLKKIGIQFVDFHITQMNELVEICHENQLTTYDGLYFLLAQEKKCKLITADEQLLKVKEMSVSLDEWQ